MLLISYIYGAINWLYNDACINLYTEATAVHEAQVRDVGHGTDYPRYHNQC